MFKFRDPRSKCSRVIVFTNTQTDIQIARHTDRYAGILYTLLEKSFQKN